MQERFKWFLTLAQDKINSYWKAMGFTHAEPPTIVFEEGPVYWRVVKSEPYSRSVYCFVRKADGAILKANSYKSPCKKNVRAYLTDTNEKISAATTEHGVIYLR